MSDEVDYRRLGLRIRRQRKSLRLTQLELADVAGISSSFLAHIESGERHPGLDTIVSLANSMNVSVDSLIQDSMNDRTLIGVPCTSRQRDVLRELAQILREHPDVWTD